MKLMLIFAVAALAIGGAGAASATPASIEDGYLVAQRECSGCHAIGMKGDSPRSDAPVFRHLLTRYHSTTLETELVEGIKLGHPDMPRFQLNPTAVDDLIAYLKSIQQ